MQHLVTLITTAAFWLHIGLGCCAHHAHATGGPACRHATVAACDDGHQHDAQSDAGNSSPPDSNTPDEPCQHAQCVFMASGKSEVAKPTFICFQPHVAVEAASSTVIASLDAAALDSGGHDVGPPVRAHLLHQVLLN